VTKYHALLLVSVILTALALVSFKIISVHARGEVIKVFSDPKLYIAIMVYGVAFLMWIVAASKIDYTVLVFSNTLGLVISGLIGYYVFKETMTVEKIVSYFLIISGVLMLITSNARA